MTKLENCTKNLDKCIEAALRDALVFGEGYIIITDKGTEYVPYHPYLEDKIKPFKQKGLEND